MASLCKNCGGNLAFSPKRQALFCNKCGATFKPEDITAEAKELLADVEAPKASDIYGSRGSYDCSIYSCTQCGGDIVINDTEASTICVYCGSPAVVFNRVAKEIRPDGIIPFSVTKDLAQMLIKTHLKKGKFIPSEIKNAPLDDIKGIYIPYWIVDCDFHDAVMVKGDVQEGKHKRTTYFAQAGEWTYQNLPCNASLRFNDNIGKKLEPFDYNEARDFDEDYLTGFYSDITDMSPANLRSAVLKRGDDMYREEVIHGLVNATKKSVVNSSPSVRIKEGEEVYLMIPAWFYTFRYKGMPHTILVNGQTGKTVGAMPFDRAKLIALTVAIFIALVFAGLLIFFGPIILLSYLFSPYIVSGFIIAGLTLGGSALRRLKQIRSNMNDTRSGSTFMFAKERQES